MYVGCKKNDNLKFPKDKIIEVGQKVRFDPFQEITGFGSESNRGLVTGTVIAVYEDHRWFLCEYGEHKQKIGFKFYQIGEDVTICG